jgi:hypothetical protein
LNQAPKRLRTLDGIEVLTLQVLDQRELRGSAIINVANDGVDRIEFGGLCSPPSSFARNDLEAPLLGRPNDDRLHHSRVLDRFRERGQRGLVEVLPGLVRIGVYLVDGNRSGVRA